jgi:hypothetical protein
MIEPDLSALSSVAFVLLDDAHGHYDMVDESAIRVIPPYGTPVEVLSTNGEWVQIKVFSKVAWMKKHYLGNTPPTKRFNISPYIVREATQVRSSVSSSIEIEFGPRGGRFVRTKLGFRRYL